MASRLNSTSIITRNTKMDSNLLYSLITGIFVGGVAGYAGSLMITKKMALTGDALSHVALPGMGLALLYHINPFWGALVFLFSGIFIIWILEQKTELSAETLTGIIFTVSLALGFLITPELELFEALFGDISKVYLSDVFFSIVFSCTVFFLLNKIYSGLTLSIISEDLAKTNGIDLKKYNLVYFFCLAIIVALGVKFVGSLLMGALVIIPAAISKNLASTLKAYSYGGMVFGAIICVLGIFISKFFSVAAGPAIILASSAIFFLSAAFRKK